MNWYVEIVEMANEEFPETVVKRMGPMAARAAEKVERGAAMNLNHKRFFVRAVEENPVDPETAGTRAFAAAVAMVTK